MPDALPIDSVLPDLHSAFAGALNVVLSAAPGAGKTTRVPLALLGESWMRNQKLIMLEPRRLAARRSAEYMAFLLGETVGETVGYRIRGEARTGKRTRIEVVTEGVLARLLHAAPELPGVPLVIFDEFHERSIHADFGLALALDVQQNLRDDLRILIMSATLDHLAVSTLLNHAPVVESQGRSYPVETRYLQFPPSGPLEPAVRDAVLRASTQTEGDILVFLPGQREIRRVEGMLLDAGVPRGVQVHTLFGEAAPEQQQAALAPDRSGQRKVILSTSIAETSLTIDGVRVVVDAGLSRMPRFDPRRGMEGLVTVPVSQASADQRRGRAGRQGPGVCYRLWTEEQHVSLPRYSPPEIVNADLAPLALDLARWGTPDGSGLRFLDPPPAAHLVQSRTLLQRLGALSSDGSLTRHGKAMADLPVHPRLAHMILRGKELGYGSMACSVAALLEERDLLRGKPGTDVDLASRVHALRSGGAVDRAARERVLAEARRLRGLAQVQETKNDETGLGMLLALAYPERIARRRDDAGARYQTAGGTGAVLPEWSALARERFLAIGEVDGVGLEVRIFLAAPVTEEDLREAFADRLCEEEEVRWNPGEEAVVARRISRIDALVLQERSFTAPADAVCAAMVEGIRQMGLAALPWDSESIRTRSEWLRTRGLAGADWPDLCDATLSGSLDEWLAPFLEGMTRRAHLARLDMQVILRSRFTHRQLVELDRLAPSALTVPTGSRIKIDYTGAQPVLAVKLQELFGQTETPTVAAGKVPVQIHLLSPAGRPLAVTQDLPSFWRNAYPEVRKEMRGRYPKHPWPEDPFSAPPMRGVKRRLT